MRVPLVSKPPQSSAELASIDGSTENRHLCRASFSLSDAANVSKVDASRPYGGTFARLMNSKTKISQRHVLTVGIKTYFLALRLSRFVTGNCQLSSEWSWTKRSCGNSGWMKRLKVKIKYCSNVE